MFHCGPASSLADPRFDLFNQIDIVEYVNNDRSNQYTLHTGSEAVCKLDPGANFDGSPLGTECLSGAGSNTGCGIKDFDGTAGAPFNAGGGGVVVLLWDNTQITLWRFARAKIPQDIHSGRPNPGGWGTPIAHWTSQSCDIENAFRDMQSMSRPVRSIGYEIENRVPSLSFQWLSTSLFAVTGLDPFSTAMGFRELAQTPSRTRPTMIVRFLTPFHDSQSLRPRSQTL